MKCEFWIHQSNAKGGKFNLIMLMDERAQTDRNRKQLWFAFQGINIMKINLYPSCGQSLLVEKSHIEEKGSFAEEIQSITRLWVCPILDLGKVRERSEREKSSKQLVFSSNIIYQQSNTLVWKYLVVSRRKSTICYSQTFH